MTIEKTTTKSSKTTDESAAVDTLTRVVETVTRDVEGLKDRLAKASVEGLLRCPRFIYI